MAQTVTPPGFVLIWWQPVKFYNYFYLLRAISDLPLSVLQNPIYLEETSKIPIEVYRASPSSNGDSCTYQEILNSEMSFSRMSFPQEDIDRGYRIINRVHAIAVGGRVDYRSTLFPENPYFPTGI